MHEDTYSFHYPLHISLVILLKEPSSQCRNYAKSTHVDIETWYAYKIIHDYVNMNRLHCVLQSQNINFFDPYKKSYSVFEIKAHGCY